MDAKVPSPPGDCPNREREATTVLYDVERLDAAKVAVAVPTRRCEPPPAQGGAENTRGAESAILPCNVLPERDIAMALSSGKHFAIAYMFVHHVFFLYQYLSRELQREAPAKERHRGICKPERVRSLGKLIVILRSARSAIKTLALKAAKL